MEFLPAATPQTESELAVIISLLDAHEIQHFVHNGGFGGLYPGMQIELYNVRRVMVRADQLEDARELLAVLCARSAEPEVESRLGIMERVRMFFETLVLGWCFPQRRGKFAKNEDDRH